MEITFEKEYLSELYYKGECVDKKHRFQPPVVKKYVKTINILESVSSIEDLFLYNGLHFEALQGNEKNIFSVRVNDQYRIEFTTKQVVSEIVVTICNIEELSNHYK